MEKTPFALVYVEEFLDEFLVGLPLLKVAIEPIFELVADFDFECHIQFKMSICL